jgi:hypothetical protein
MLEFKALFMPLARKIFERGIPVQLVDVEVLVSCRFGNQYSRIHPFAAW